MKAIIETLHFRQIGRNVEDVHLAQIDVSGFITQKDPDDRLTFSKRLNPDEFEELKALIGKVEARIVSELK